MTSKREVREAYADNGEAMSYCSEKVNRITPLKSHG